MTYLRTDQYTSVDQFCPVRTELHTPDGVVEVTIGEHRLNETTLRLVLDCPEACHRLAQAFHDAGCQLTRHIRAQEHPDPAMTQLDAPLTASIAS